MNRVSSGVAPATKRGRVGERRQKRGEGEEGGSDLLQTSWAFFMVFPALLMSSCWKVIMASISSTVA